jgi:hypothetical protein
MLDDCVTKQHRKGHARAQIIADAAIAEDSHFVDPAEQPPSINCRSGDPIVQFGSHLIGNRNRSNVASLANEINNGPMVFALLEMIQCQGHGFMPPQPTRE